MPLPHPPDAWGDPANKYIIGYEISPTGDPGHGSSVVISSNYHGGHKVHDLSPARQTH